MIPRYAPVPRSGSSGSGSGGGAGSSGTSRPRGLALLVAVLALAALVLGTGVVVRPLWWRLKADLTAAHSGVKPSPSAAQTAAAAASLGERERLMAAARDKPVVTPATEAVRMDNVVGVPPAAAVKAAAAPAEKAAVAAKAKPAKQDDKEEEAAAPPAAAPPPAKAATPTTTMDDAARAALRARLDRMTPEQLERAREQARERQWDQEWWRQYQSVEAARRDALREKHAASERRTVARFNVTLNEATARGLAHPDGGFLFVTWANAHYTDFALSWVERLRACGLGDHLIVGAMDDAVLASLAKRRVPTFAMQSGLTHGDLGWGSKAFAKMGRLKIRLIATFLRLGVAPVVSDVDVAWLRDPLPLFRLYPTADVLTSSDHLHPTTRPGDDASLESWPEAGSAFNIGMMVFRPGGNGNSGGGGGGNALRFVDEWIDAIERDLGVWDQNAFNDLVRRGRPQALAEGDAALDLPASAAESVAAAGAALAEDAREFGLQQLLGRGANASSPPSNASAAAPPPLTKEALASIARGVYGAGADGSDPVAAHRRRASRLFRGDEGRLVVGILSVSAFANGHTFFVQRLPERQGVRPFAAHGTFVFSGTEGKRHRMRERALWTDDAAHFKPRGGFLAFDLDVPRALLAAAGPRTGKADLANAEGHFALVNHQLSQVRAALALATTLNRTLVLPELWCGLDRWWAPHAGTIPGSQFELPFRCPADHVLDLEGGLAAEHLDANRDEFGPPIPFREHSLFANPQMPAAALGSTVHVDACARGTPGCSDGQNPATTEYNRVRVAERMPSDRLLASLASVEPIMTLRVSGDVRRLWGGFSRAEDDRRFRRRTSHYGGVWCCADAHPGHVHYDLWWDEAHVDRFGRKWAKGEWRPTTGP